MPQVGVPPPGIPFPSAEAATGRTQCTHKALSLS